MSWPSSQRDESGVEPIGHRSASSATCAVAVTESACLASFGDDMVLLDARFGDLNDGSTGFERHINIYSDIIWTFRLK
jgi:hypothetical protein